MPTEQHDADGDAIREAGFEFGTVTGRPRRCGWFDAELVHFTAQINGFTEIVLTKLDVLDGLPRIKIGVGYRTEADNEIHHYWEGDARWLGSIKPEYIEVNGWQRPTKGVRLFGKLPKAAQAYVRKIEELVGVPVGMVATGPGREEIIQVPSV